MGRFLPQNEEYMDCYEAFDDLNLLELLQPEFPLCGTR